MPPEQLPYRQIEIRQNRERLIHTLITVAGLTLAVTSVAAASAIRDGMLLGTPLSEADLNFAKTVANPLQLATLGHSVLNFLGAAYAIGRVVVTLGTPPPVDQVQTGAQAVEYLENSLSYGVTGIVGMLATSALQGAINPFV